MVLSYKTLLLLDKTRHLFTKAFVTCKFCWGVSHLSCYSEFQRTLLPREQSKCLTSSHTFNLKSAPISSDDNMASATITEMCNCHIGTIPCVSKQSNFSATCASLFCVCPSSDQSTATLRTMFMPWRGLRPVCYHRKWTWLCCIWGKIRKNNYSSVKY